MFPKARGRISDIAGAVRLYAQVCIGPGADDQNYKVNARFRLIADFHFLKLHVRFQPFSMQTVGRKRGHHFHGCSTRHIPIAGKRPLLSKIGTLRRFGPRIAPRTTGVELVHVGREGQKL